VVYLYPYVSQAQQFVKRYNIQQIRKKSVHKSGRIFCARSTKMQPLKIFIYLYMYRFLSTCFVSKHTLQQIFNSYFHYGMDLYLWNLEVTSSFMITDVQRLAFGTEHHRFYTYIIAK